MIKNSLKSLVSNRVNSFRITNQPFLRETLFVKKANSCIFIENDFRRSFFEKT